MPLVIRPVSPDLPAARALLDASHALMAALFPPDENAVLDATALAEPDVTFYGAEESGALLGCVALKRHPEFAEVKSLFVAPEARGIGLGARLLAHVEAEAAREGLPLVRLETGDKLMAASALYRRAGYRARGPFGSYRANASSVFFEKALTAPATAAQSRERP
ncbi:acetyltransferase, GNAT family protein [Roseivivax marinus]|uniref:Acetyltransferase, GNAT family protein n=1 Tax=Roseivivax marinus TaxID=1379903 RepID=W4HI54_9RHOB|nr:GNAT family N-acetyltransferase [Roseivivax marinus]ETW12402.1 acetyltransferase, GNAT family protein [Roseivivax marinus]SEK24678.1 putative acetyltransferase [Roseivivax marinus]